jgi:hypothetical protein
MKTNFPKEQIDLFVFCVVYYTMLSTWTTSGPMIECTEKDLEGTGIKLNGILFRNLPRGSEQSHVNTITQPSDRAG